MRIPLKSVALLTVLAALGRPTLAQSSSGRDRENELNELLARAASRSAPLTTSYSGWLLLEAGPGTHVTATVTRGKVQCTGNDGGDPPVSYAGPGRIDLELGLTDSDSPGTHYRITLHCPVDNDGRSLRDMATTYLQPGGEIRTVDGRIQGPEQLKGEEAGLYWELSRVGRPRPPSRAP